MYLAASKLVVNAVLLKQGPNGSQLLVYYVSKELMSTEQNYTMLKKMALALRMASKNLCPYFQEHQVNVSTDVPF